MSSTNSSPIVDFETDPEPDHNNTVTMDHRNDLQPGTSRTRTISMTNPANPDFSETKFRHAFKSSEENSVAQNSQIKEILQRANLPRDLDIVERSIRSLSKTPPVPRYSRNNGSITKQVPAQSNSENRDYRSRSSHQRQSYPNNRQATSQGWNERPSGRQSRCDNYDSRRREHPLSCNHDDYRHNRARYHRHNNYYSRHSDRSRSPRRNQRDSNTQTTMSRDSSSQTSPKRRRCSPGSPEGTPVCNSNLNILPNQQALCVHTSTQKDQSIQQPFRNSAGQLAIAAVTGYIQGFSKAAILLSNEEYVGIRGGFQLCKRPPALIPKPGTSMKPENIKQQSSIDKKRQSFTDKTTVAKQIHKNLISCKACNHTFGSRRAATYHMTKEHCKKLCPVCFLPFPLKGHDLKEHFIMEHAKCDSEEKAPCPICKKKFSFENMLGHVSREHLKYLDAKQEATAPEIPPSEQKHCKCCCEMKSDLNKKFKTDISRPLPSSEGRPVQSQKSLNCFDELD